MAVQHVSKSTSGTRRSRRTASLPLDLGIDLGTTRTVVARADRGNYPVVAFADTLGDEHDYLPSLTALTQDGLVHGFQAQEAARNGAPLLRSLKRRLSDPGVSASTRVELGDRSFTVHEVLTSYLTHVRELLRFSPVLNGLDPASPQARVAVAVPAHAYGAQRLITLDAFRAAGFHVTSMLNEPSAAGFEYTHRKGSTVSARRTRVLVYDLGGGTFDTSLVDVQGTAHEVLASHGVPDLGGDDVDILLAQMVLARAGLAEEDLAPQEVNDLFERCREAKEALAPQTRRIVVDVRDKDVVLQASELYDAAADLIERTLETMAPLVGRMEDGEPDLTDVAGVYMVGGASSFPMVPRVLRERFGRRVHRSAFPGASTAIGLAVAADRGAVFELTDRLSRGFGVFREADDGARTAFDAILSQDAVQAGSRAGRSPVTTVITRRYPAVHNVGVFRFVECAGVDAEGEPRGELAPYADVVFPFDASLREVEDLSTVKVQRAGAGPLIEERYEVDDAGIVRVTLTDLSDGYARSYVLGEQLS